MHYVHVGSRSDDSEQLDKIIESSPVKDRIHLVGYVDQSDLAALYSAAFALVFPILNEGFGPPAIEAMACGTPAILSTTAAPEITQGVAMLVDVLSEEEIADAMGALANNPTSARWSRKKGRAKAATFTWEATGTNSSQSIDRSTKKARILGCDSSCYYRYIALMDSPPL